MQYLILYSYTIEGHYHVEGTRFADTKDEVRDVIQNVREDEEELESITVYAIGQAQDVTKQFIA